MTGQLNPAQNLGHHLRLYSTVRVSLLDRASGEALECVYGAAAEYEEAITCAMAKFHTEEYPENDLMLYFAIPDDLPMERTIKGKILSARPTVHAEGETLYAALDLTLSEGLTDMEINAFQEQVKVQYRDGWGAAFELTNIPTDDPHDICMRLYHEGLDFFTADALNEHHIAAVFYCPVDIHLFPDTTVHEVIQDEDGLYESRDDWDAALVKTPQDYAELLDRALQSYCGGNIALDYSPENKLPYAHCAVVGNDNGLWLKVECAMGKELSALELEMLQKCIAGSIAEKCMVARWPDQWGWLNIDAGALIIRPQPVEDWSFSTNGYQPCFEDLVDENHLLTESEWLGLGNICQSNTGTGLTGFRM